MSVWNWKVSNKAGQKVNYQKELDKLILELKKEAIANWGSDFSQKKFHQTILELGPATFSRIEKYILHPTGK